MTFLRGNIEGIQVNCLFFDSERADFFDGSNEITAVTAQSLSNLFFSAFQSVHVVTHENKHLRFYSRHWAIRKALEGTEGFKILLDYNQSIFDPRKRKINSQFDTQIFQNDVKKKIFENLNMFAENAEEVGHYKKLFGSLLDFFKVFWQRRQLENNEELIQNTEQIIDVII